MLKECYDHGLENIFKNGWEPNSYILSSDVKQNNTEREWEEREKDFFYVKASPFRNIRHKTTENLQEWKCGIIWDSVRSLNLQRDIVIGWC